MCMCILKCVFTRVCAGVHLTVCARIVKGMHVCVPSLCACVSEWCVRVDMADRTSCAEPGVWVLGRPWHASLARLSGTPMLFGTPVLSSTPAFWD